MTPLVSSPHPRARRPARRGAWTGLALALWAAAAPAQPAPEAEGPSELDFFAVNEELERQTSLASSRTLSVRESPGSITVITREEILDSGARDLSEVLQRVPGFSFNTDYYGMLTLGVRGLQAVEGRALVLLDGQVLNEPSYGTFAFGDHVPLDIIASIEVMRGPAFALYGETAELAVIHIHTRSAADLQGASVSARHARSADMGVLSSVALSAADRFESVPGLSASISAATGESSPADADYVDVSGGSVGLGRANRRRPLHLNLGVTYKDLQVRVLQDAYRTRSRDGIESVMERTATNDFYATIVDATYVARLSERLTLTPRLTWRYQQPWKDSDPESEGFYHKTVKRYVARLTLAYKAHERLHLFAGTDGYVERAHLDQPEFVGRGFQRPFGDSLSLTLRNLAAFGEASLDTPWATLVAGLRYERHSQFGDTLVPRVALTRAFDRFHAKLLASGAFRAPMLENIAVNPDLSPERARIFEAEVGYQLTDALYAAVNAFDVNIRDTILYFVEPESGLDAYRNGEGTGSRGVELEARLRTQRVNASLVYAFASAAGKNRVEDFAVPGDDSVLLGFARHTLTLHSSVRLAERLTLSPSLVLLGARTGFTAVDAATGELVAEPLPAVALAHLFLHWRDAGVRGLDVGVGVRNLFDAAHALPQPYNGGHAPLPGPGREFVGRVSFTLPFE